MPDDPSYYGWRKGWDQGLIGTVTTNSKDPNATRFDLPYPAYFAEKLASKFVTAGDAVVAATSDRADLAAYAIKRRDGHLALLIINKSPMGAIDEAFDVAGFTPSGSSHLFQYGIAQDDLQKAGKAADLLETDPTFAVAAAPGGVQFRMSFPAYSMSVVVLAPKA